MTDKKNKVIITIVEEEDDFDIRLEFDPEYNKKNPTQAALLALNCVEFMGKLLESDIKITGQESRITVPLGELKVKHISQ